MTGRGGEEGGVDGAEGSAVTESEVIQLRHAEANANALHVARRCGGADVGEHLAGARLALVGEPLRVVQRRRPIRCSRRIRDARCGSPIIHLRVAEALNGCAAIDAARIPRDEVEAIADLSRDYPATRLSKDVDARRARTTEVQEEWTNLVRLVGGGEEGDGKFNRWPIRCQVVARHSDGRAEELWIAASNGIGDGAALPVDGAARNEARGRAR